MLIAIYFKGLHTIISATIVTDQDFYFFGKISAYFSCPINFSLHGTCMPSPPANLTALPLMITVTGGKKAA